MVRRTYSLGISGTPMALVGVVIICMLAFSYVGVLYRRVRALAARKTQPDQPENQAGRGNLALLRWQGLSTNGSLTAPPMDGQDDFARGVVDMGDNAGDQGPQQLLTGAHAYPDAFQAASRSLANPEKPARRQRLPRLHCREVRLARRHALKRRFAALFELRGDRPVVQIAGCVTALRERRLVAGLL